jgi:hypothetical protein
MSTAFNHVTGSVDYAPGVVESWRVLRPFVAQQIDSASRVIVDKNDILTGPVHLENEMVEFRREGCRLACALDDFVAFTEEAGLVDQSARIQIVPRGTHVRSAF